MRLRDAYERGIRRLVGRAIGDFRLIEENDRVLVGLSGGKDSWTLLHMLSSLRQRAPIPFSLVAVTVHPEFPGFDAERVEKHLQAGGYEFRIVRAPIHEALLGKVAPGDSPCPLCSRIRRGVLYTQATELGCTKIALGHHREDFLETLLLNQFFNGTIRGMDPLHRSDDGRHTVIRPLAYVPEEDIVRYVSLAGFSVACCACPWCDDPNMKRAKMKKLLADLEGEHRGTKASLFAALMDRNRRSMPMSPEHAHRHMTTERCES
ncbi:MAG TPA: tRNA 2-thiocytidine(32) synthetase TtcA [Nitrospiraceae bacterium]|nr:tRNA 2-thiocytidine(32) synthetase TtcA [Nitrospiraceae bacterium]